MLVSFHKSYITVFATNFSYPLLCFYLLNYKIRACYKTKIKDVHELRECVMDEWDKLDQRIFIKFC